MPELNRRLVLAERPSGNVDDSTVRVERDEIPEPGPGEALVRTRFISIDPTIRTWMDDAPGYLPPIGIGDVIRAGALGEVVRSNSDRYAEGDARLRHDRMAGLRDRRRRRAGDAAGAGGDRPPRRAQRVRAHGPDRLLRPDRRRPGQGGRRGRRLRRGGRDRVGGRPDRADQGRRKVVGIAGGAEKCAWLVDELGFDEAIDYQREQRRRRALRERCPDGIDLFFDNVGGEILDDCLARLALRGRVVLCGAIATYNDSDGPPPGPRNYLTC